MILGCVWYEQSVPIHGGAMESLRLGKNSKITDSNL